MRLQHVSQHVGTVGMCPSEVLRTRLTLGVGLDEEAAEVRNHAVDLRYLVLPPTDDISVKRVGGLQSTHLDG